ncbi:hypothetical protein RvY_19472 [Ramazzottius varieornatus]|uniref:Uncharacterized protein n=1 Tax=Ramazzottius varieornatus TaxID=947166 RepID=A0A1D1WB58_RAMVA|nr:hypothetical protein RvY_19472 [Ramazzottius varieornatus]
MSFRGNDATHSEKSIRRYHQVERQHSAAAYKECSLHLETRLVVVLDIITKRYRLATEHLLSFSAFSGVDNEVTPNCGKPHCPCRPSTVDIRNTVRAQILSVNCSAGWRVRVLHCRNRK